MKRMQSIIKLYFSSMRSFEEIERTPKSFGTDELLYASEIHTIVAIGDNPNANMTELASVMDITKGGVQKFVKKLLVKDLIYKTQLPDNKRDVMFGLTEKGLVAYTMHQRFEKERFGQIFELMDSMDEEKLQVLEEFLLQLNEILSAGE